MVSGEGPATDTASAQGRAPAPAGEASKPGRLSAWRAEYALLLLVVLSVAGLLLYEPLMSHTMVIEPNATMAPVISVDSLGGGDSEAHRGPAPGFELLCTLKPRLQYRYCGIVLQFDPQRRNGVNLSSARRLRIWMDYAGPTPTFLVTLRNANPAYGMAMDQADAAKYNQIEVETTALRGGVLEADLADFHVANWWMQKLRVPTRLSRPEFDNIIALGVFTGSGPAVGDYRIVLHKVEIETQLLSREQWYLVIMCVWLGAAMVYLLLRLGRLKAQSSQLVRLASTDALTGAVNRKGLDEALAQAHAGWRVGDPPLGLVLIDIDHFKSVNDQLGHQAGDRVLSGLAALLRASVRSQDLLGRWGGEEFLLVCRGATLEQLAGIAEKLRRRVEGNDFGGGIRVTASFGVAGWAPGESLEELFAAADAALYRAKSGGRNQVVAAPPPLRQG